MVLRLLDVVDGGAVALEQVQARAHAGFDLSPPCLGNAVVCVQPLRLRLRGRVQERDVYGVALLLARVG